MKFLFLTCSSAQEDWSDLALETYLKKIKPFVKFEVHSLKLRKSSRDEASLKKKNDSDQILDFIEESDYVILFDEKGDSLDSKAFAQSISRILQTGKKRVIWIIGGAYGVDERVKERAQKRIALSKMVMNHLVAQTVALEQIYRGFAILNNLPYHNE